MPEMNGLELQEALAAQRQDLAVVFITGAGDIPASVKAMKAGAIDFLTKPFEDEKLVAATQEAICRSKQLFAANEALERDWAVFRSLTKREQQVCLLVAKALLNKQIAGELGSTEKTIKSHRGSVMRKLRVGSVAELVQLVRRLRDGGRIEGAAAVRTAEQSG